MGRQEESPDVNTGSEHSSESYDARIQEVVSELAETLREEAQKNKPSPSITVGTFDSHGRLIKGVNLDSTICAVLAEELEPEGIRFNAYGKRSYLGFSECDIQFTEIGGNPVESDRVYDTDEYMLISPPTSTD